MNSYGRLEFIKNYVFIDYNRTSIKSGCCPDPLKASIKETRNPKTGKPVTVVTGITHNPQVIEKLTKKLKSACGAGGHIEGKTIIIQGSHTSRVSGLLSNEGYTVST